MAKYNASIHHSHETVEDLQRQIDSLHYDLRHDYDGEVRERINTLIRRKNAILHGRT